MQKQKQQQGGKQKAAANAGQKGGKQQAKAKEKKNNSGENEDVKREQKLQAVLLADSFTKSFRPMSLETPKVLLPLVNVPMLDYTIEFLAQNGVEEIFIFCVWQADLVQSYVNSSKWISKISVKCISSSACLSAGDALREMDSMNIIRSDPFILISGDVVANLDLKKAIAFHKSKRKDDINNVMTIVLKHVQKSAGIRPVLDDLVVALDSSSSQIVLFDDAHTNKNVKIPLEVMTERPALTFHTDLLDCNVDICSPELILQFSDNFDYQDIRKDFIQNEVSNWALGKHVYGYIIQNEYAARVQDQRSYHTICRDIVTRWVYPFVPDGQLLQDNTFQHTRHYTYKEKGAKVARSAVIAEGVVLGAGAVVGEHARIQTTIIGRDCTIGSRAELVQSHIWKGAVIGNNAKITLSIVCDGAVVEAGAVVPRGCVIGYGVVVGQGVVLPEFTKLYNPSRCQGQFSNSDGSEVSSSSAVWVGSDGVSASEEGGTEVCEFGLSDLDVMRAGSIGCTDNECWKRCLWDTCEQPVESDDDEDSLEYNDVGEVMEQGADGAGNGHSSGQDSNFIDIISEMVSTGNSENHPPDNLLMEIKGCKFAQNKTYSDCLAGIVPAVLCIAAGATSDFKQAQFINMLKVLLANGGWGYQLVKAMVQEKEDEIALITAVEYYVLQPENAVTVYPLFRFVLQIMYDSEIVREEALLQWIASRDIDDDDFDDEDERKRVKLFREPAVQAFVEWIQESDDEDEDDDCDDDDSDSNSNSVSNSVSNSDSNSDSDENGDDDVDG